MLTPVIAPLGVRGCALTILCAEFFMVNGIGTKIFSLIGACVSIASISLAEPLIDSEKGSLIVIGQGESSSLPEYAAVSVQVTSICYDSSRAAMSANAELANKILNVLNRYKKNARDEVVALGGMNVRQTETIYLGSASKVLCELKWRASNHLRIEMGSIADLPDLQDEILKVVDLATGVSPEQVAQTYAEIGQTSFQLYPETTKALRKEAQIKAYDDAKAQLDTFAKRCGLENLKLLSITPPEYRVAPKYSDMGFAAASSRTPIVPDELSVSAVWRFEWSFNPTSGCR